MAAASTRESGRVQVGRIVYDCGAGQPGCTEQSVVYPGKLKAGGEWVKVAVRCVPSGAAADREKELYFHARAT